MFSNREVRQFAEACHLHLPDRPTLLNANDIDFVKQMVSDEMQELEEAKDVTEQADALVDAIYYILDTASRKGINLDPLFKIVHHANMTKISENGKVLRRADGKILKPLGWVDPKPLLVEAINKQIENGAFTRGQL